METKEELTAEINKLLSLSLDSLSRMTVDDLKQLRDSLSKMGPQPEVMRLFRRPLKDVVNEKVLGKSLGDLSLEQLLSGTGDSGILGLGVLPKLRDFVSGRSQT